MVLSEFMAWSFKNRDNPRESEVQCCHLASPETGLIFFWGGAVFVCLFFAKLPLLNSSLHEQLRVWAESSTWFIGMVSIRNAGFSTSYEILFWGNFGFKLFLHLYPSKIPLNLEESFLANITVLFFLQLYPCNLSETQSIFQVIHLNSDLLVI